LTPAAESLRDVDLRQKTTGSPGGGDLLHVISPSNIRASFISRPPSSLDLEEFFGGSLEQPKPVGISEKDEGEDAPPLSAAL
jgi:hypothetical protein